MLLKTQRLTIRRITPEDWAGIRAIWQDFQHSAYARYDILHPTQSAEVRAKIAGWAAANHGTAHMFLAVCLGEAVIGYIALHERAQAHEIGYCFHSAYHGQGYARESLSAVLHALRPLGITRFTAGTALDNAPSVALLKALGFAQTGTERVSFYRDSEGQPIFFDGGIFELDSARQPSSLQDDESSL